MFKAVIPRKTSVLTIQLARLLTQKATLSSLFTCFHKILCLLTTEGTGITHTAECIFMQAMKSLANTCMKFKIHNFVCRDSSLPHEEKIKCYIQ